MQHQPKTVHYKLEAGKFQWELAQGKTIEAWGFNGQLPGPELRAKKGDTLVIEVTNNLDEATIIHWHGLRLPASMDGTGEVQKPIMPGETFEYRFTAPDAGTFWYHSHANETVQMERGMYGSLIIEDDTDPVFDNDRVFMVDDMKLTPDSRFVESKKLNHFKERHDGREGETALINGKEMPVIKIHAGQTERWRFINAASARYFLLHMGGKPFQIIGTDGGLLETAQTVTEALITPGERLDIAMGGLEAGETFALETLPYNRMTFLKSKRKTYATVKVLDAKPSVAHLPAQFRIIEPLTTQDAAVNRKVKLSVGPSIKHGLDFKVNNTLHANDGPVVIGELQVWEVSNVSLMDHPFHLHGFFFQVLEENGKAPEYRAWKDTYNLKPRTTIKIAWMPDNRPGKWMYHCHILEHHEAGMMANFEVIDGSKPYVPSLSEHHCH